MPSEYAISVYFAPEGWRRVALLPGTLGFRFVCIIAEECSLAWIAPIQVERAGEVVMQVGLPEAA